MLDDDRLPAAVLKLLQPQYGLGVVVQRVAPEELHPPGGEIGVDLRGHQDGHVIPPGYLQKELRLPHELGPCLGLVVPQAVEHGERIYDHEGYGPVLGELADLLDPVGLLLQAVHLEHQEVLDRLLVTGEDLSQPLVGQPLVVDVGDLLPPLGHLTGRLEADVGLPGARLPVQQRDATRLDPAPQEAVELWTSE